MRLVMRRAVKRWMLCCLTALLPSIAGAADLAPDGALARWLDTEAGPTLAATLARHPRVAGEAVAFAAVVDGVPVEQRDALRAAVERRLRAHLLRASGVRLALRRTPTACGPEPAAQLLVGVDVHRSGRRGGEVSLGLLDVAEGQWVPGVALSWRGTLEGVEREALARVSMDGVPGTSTHPIARDDVERIAAALHERLACGAPPTATGAVFVDVDPQRVDARVAAAFRAGFAGSARWLPVSDPSAARWRLRLEGAGANGHGVGPVTANAIVGTSGLASLRLSLASIDGSDAQLVAVVFRTAAPVGGSVASTSAPVPPTTSAPTPAAAGATTRAPTLLGDVAHEVVRRRGVCARDDDARCVEISMELERDAWLVVATSREGRLLPLSCEPPSQRSDAGERRWRLSVGPLSADQSVGRPAAGLYVLATRDAAVARALGRIVSEAPGACGNRSSAGAVPWIEVLARFVDVHAADLDWRAVHLFRGAGGRVERMTAPAAIAAR